jgi:hypothetical protein
MRQLLVTSAVLALLVVFSPAAEAGKRGTFHYRNAKQKTQVSQFSYAPQGSQAICVDGSPSISSVSRGTPVRISSNGQIYTLAPSRVAAASAPLIQR